ncbi:hypothetical protein Pla22_20580 [Rubripirellula amarantea]|uniref:Uncharacterized protein n=1 Tax=Rubripirellula amarantea TaxID=2527999 RepID=A0A5C5WW85_9BACT|nr:hypothetical protein [Rubripirellula amarantea]TWT54411.1 hypothetical protein Pla22_20580 [Rubripirellula amarantea]
MLRLTLLTLSFSAAFLSPASAQLIFQESQQQSTGDAFAESSSVGGFLRGDNFFFNFPGGGPMLPPFAGEALGGGGGLSGGVGFAGGGVSGGLNFNFAQGSTRSFGSTSAGVTTMDGYPGSIQSGTVRPFVTSVTPIVSQLQQRADAFAAIGRQQLADLRQSQASLADRRLQSHLNRAISADSDGDYRVAIANYNRAIAASGGSLRFQLEQRVETLKNLIREERIQKRQSSVANKPQPALAPVPEPVPEPEPEPVPEQ